MPRLIGNARRYERSEGRRDTRSGHYERRLQTKVVKLGIAGLLRLSGAALVALNLMPSRRSGLPNAF
jgi:hypothetical protein